MLCSFTEDNQSQTAAGPARGCSHSGSNSEAGSQASLGFCVNMGKSIVYALLPL